MGTEGQTTSLPGCLLCGKKELKTVRHLTGAQLRSLWKQIEHDFTPEAWASITPATTVEMLCCRACGFTFFKPDLAGGEAFYRELEREGYYSPGNPEFARTNEFAARQGLRRVLDVGCGSGFYLDLARAQGMETFGLELNTAAAEKARAKGHTIFKQLLHELDPKTLGGFDLITLFQVLEHVPDPVSVMQQAARFLKPGGYISIAVPFADGIYRLCLFDPHEWPPHHISHWRLADFEQLAAASGLRLTERGGDVLVGSLISHFWQLHNRLAPAIGERPRFGGAALPKFLSLCYRKAGMKFLLPHGGGGI